MRIENQVRVQSIDILRGLVMVIMALDHVRDFFHVTAMTADPVNPETTYPALFFTRWITHFCAPVFVFLSGVSARLAGTKRSPAQLSRFLITRGLWLVVVEIVIVTLGITFNPFYNVIILQVIWAIGTSMILLGLLVRTSLTVLGIIGVLLFFGHNITNYLPVPSGPWGIAYNVLLTTKAVIYNISSNRVIFDLYAVLPWTGVMLMGYVSGYYFLSKINPDTRRRHLLVWGSGAILLFLLLRFLNEYGDPAPWKVQKDYLYSFLSFLNTTKYPPSLMFLLMTLGPALIFLSFLERAQNRLTGIFAVYGKVPFFYYVVHFYLIHLLTVLAFYATGHSSAQIVDPNTPFLFRPVNFGFDLWAVYLIWIFVVVVLYKPCLWFSRYKKGHKQWWLSYI
ncbi:MAG TPA: heparan-alpha-glucosaminide N-acetyltransferase domain-containing protein [Sphingobacteriaceae bacterium]